MKTLEIKLKTLRIFGFILGVLLVGDFVLIVWGEAKNIEGDGLESSTTMMAFLTGYERIEQCHWYDARDTKSMWDYSQWKCGPQAFLRPLPWTWADEPATKSFLIWWKRWYEVCLLFVLTIVVNALWMRVPKHTPATPTP